MINKEFKGWIKKSDGRELNVEIGVELVYDAEYDPYAVQLILSQDGDEDVVWTVGRDLMVQGVNSYIPVGKGDVRFRYLGVLHGQLLMCLRTQVAHADISLPQPPVVDFLNETLAAVPQGQEQAEAQLDEALAEILSS